MITTETAEDFESMQGNGTFYVTLCDGRLILIFTISETLSGVISVTLASVCTRIRKSGVSWWLSVALAAIRQHKDRSYTIQTTVQTICTAIVRPMSAQNFTRQVAAAAYKDHFVLAVQGKKTLTVSDRDQAC